MYSADRLKGIATFVAVANTGSFTAAADRLNLTNSAISKSVARLEQRLGECLFERTTRSLALTEAGEAYYKVCTRILSELEEAENTMTAQRSEPAGNLRIDLPASFGRSHVMPLIVAFSERYPKLRPHVSFTDRVVDLRAEGIDLAVRIGGSKVWPATLGHHYLGTERLIFCAAPGYLARHGVPQTVEELDAHGGVLYGRPDGSANPWLFVDETGQVESRTVNGRIVIGDAEAGVAAVASGLGIGQLATWLINDRLRRGELIEILPHLATEGLPVHLVWLRSRESLPKVQALLEMLSAQLVVD